MQHITHETRLDVRAHPSAQHPCQHPIQWRAPHTFIPIGEIEIDLYAPPTPPAPPERMGWLNFAYVGGMIFALLVIGLVSKSTSWFLFSVPMMAMSAIVPWLMERRRWQQYETEVAERESKYHMYLEERRRTLDDLTHRIRATLQKQYPQNIVAGLKISHHTPDRRIWVRMPHDESFLTLRVGEGHIPAPFTIKFHGSENPLESDRLLVAARRLREQYSTIPDAPVILSLQQFPRFGIAVYDENSRIRIGNNIITQLAVFHAPSEVQIALFCEEDETPKWQWMRWLPHVHEQGGKRRFLATTESQRAALAQHLELILQEREQQVSEKYTSTGDEEKQATLILPAIVVVITQPKFVMERQSLLNLLNKGPQYGIFFIVLAERERYLPALVRSSIHVGRGPNTTFLRREKLPDITRITFDEVSSREAEDFARKLAPWRDPALSESGDIPTLVTLFELLGIQDISNDLKQNLYTFWDLSLQRMRHIVAPLGKKAGGEILEIDLHERAHGPNGLVAGMVGAGKSELLQTLVAMLATRYHPHQVSFVLIDYKGGGMAEVFRALPHTLGIITNLQDPTLAQRAIKSLTVEMQRRQDLFNKVNVSHIDDYHRRLYGKKQEEHQEAPQETLPPLPYLVIIVDEFAEMKMENPDLAQEFIRIARLGRALGLRLILAMQKPAGIVDSQIEANTRFRLCLRVAQVEDSRTMIRRPDAAYIKNQGRAFFQVGVNELFYEFQVAWAGAPYVPGGVNEEETRIFKVTIDGERIPVGDPLFAPPPLPQDGPETQLQALVQFLHEAFEEYAQERAIEPLPKLWSDPLPERILLQDVLPTSQIRWKEKTWFNGLRFLRPIIGLIDDPVNPIPHLRQRPLVLDLLKDGSIALYGAPGAGKTYFLMTLLTSIALNHPPEEVHFYILDFSGGAFSIFSELPHTGAVIMEDEKDRHERLLRLLTRLLEERRSLFRERGISDIREWWQKYPDEPMPSLVLCIDNYAAFEATYKGSPREETFFESLERQLVRLIRDGRRWGIHVVITALNMTDIKTKMRASFGRQLTLRMQDAGVYSDLLGARTRMQPAPLPGRGLIAIEEGGRATVYEFQVAIPFAAETDFELRQQLQALFKKMQESPQAQRIRPPAVRILPQTFTITEFLNDEALTIEPPKGHLLLPLGYDTQDVEVFSLDMTRSLGILALGSPGSGKTNFLANAITLLTFLYGQEVTFTLIDSRQSELQRIFQVLPHVMSLESNERDQWLPTLRKRLQESTWHILCIDDLPFEAFTSRTSLFSEEEQKQLRTMLEELHLRILVTGSMELVKAIRMTTLPSLPLFSGWREYGELVFIESAPSDASDLVPFAETKAPWGKGVLGYAKSPLNLKKIKTPQFHEHILRELQHRLQQ
ncbi:MAG: type VII secretion protein EssC [Ardenticatenia bacterium]|nr:MAG: type VII secretion protein EssC [Ardenticatenia bacterium]